LSKQNTTMSIEEIKTIIEQTGSYTGEIPNVAAMYYNGFSQKKGVWTNKTGKVNQTALMRHTVTGPGTYEVKANYGSVVTFANKLRHQGHNVSTKRIDSGAIITWTSRDEEFNEIFSKLNLQECLAVKEILDGYVDRLTR